MVIKESARRGYMNQDEINAHLENLGYKGKIAYLKEVLDGPHKNRLAPETRKNVARVLAKNYEENHSSIKAAQVLLHHVKEDRDKAIDLLKNGTEEGADILASEGEKLAAARILDNIGRKSYYYSLTGTKYYGKDRNCLLKAAELYEQEGDLEKAAYALQVCGEGLYDSNPVISLRTAKLFEKAAEKTENLYVKREFLKETKERLEQGGAGVGAVRIGRKLKSLEEEIQMEEEKWKNKGIATTSILGILGGIFFLSSNITGNAIADLTTKTTSFLGAGLLIVGLIAGFFYIKDKKK